MCDLIARLLWQQPKRAAKPHTSSQAVFDSGIRLTITSSSTNQISLHQSIQLGLQGVLVGGVDFRIEPRGDAFEGAGQGGVEMTATALAYQGHGGLQGQGFLVGALGREGVEDIHDGEDAGIEGNGIPDRKSTRLNS